MINTHQIHDFKFWRMISQTEDLVNIKTINSQLNKNHKFILLFFNCESILNS